MAVNYNDERFLQVQREQNQALTDLNNRYNQMIADSDRYYQDAAQAAEDYGKKQAEIQQANTDFTIERINQQKEQSEKDYVKEQKASYVDWQKQSNQYGVHQEQLAAAGLRGGGYSESSQVSMYNQYQNRVGQARETFNKVTLEYDNSIKEAQLTNNAKLAEIAYDALQKKLEISLNGFQYKNQLLANQINAQQALNDTYYNRWQDVLKQINTENALAEEKRQFDEQMALQSQAQAASASRSYSISGGGSSGSSKNGSYSINGSGGSNQPTTVNGKKVTATNDYIQDASGQYLQLYKTSDGSLYYWDGSSYKAWSEKKKSSGLSSAMKSVASAVKKTSRAVKRASSGGGRHG
jgi:hypothetical protein